MDARKPWRSLEQLADDPKAVAFLEREFPEGASEPPEGVSRRTVLSLLGASLSMAGLAACRRPVEKIVPYTEAPENVIPGVPRRYATTMPLGLSSYGLVVESHEGRPTKIEGNELHPATQGASSAWIQASILDLYDPDRSRQLRKDGAASDWPAFAAAWGEMAQEHAADGGAGLAVLCESYSSPTLSRLSGEFRARYPHAAWVNWEPVSDENALRGIERATGGAHRLLNHFDRAQVILSLDSDFLVGEADAVRAARGYASGRRVRATQDEMNRLYVVEAAHSVTGANADHRLPLASDRVGAFAVALHSRLKSKGLPLEGNGAAPQLSDVAPEWLDAAADDLLAHRGSSLLVVGRRQPEAVHALALAINSALGNLGQTVQLFPATDAGLPDSGQLGELVSAMKSGSVKTLVTIGGNPVYQAAADLEFGSALTHVATVIHLSDRVDETSALAHWHIPRTHFLECWGDARTVDGVRSVIQPLIEPLYAGKSDVELLGLLADGEDTSGHDRVRSTWRAFLGELDFDRRWNRTLHDGLLEDDVLEPVQPGIVGSADFPGEAAREATTDSLELVFQASNAVFDGRYANNGWLQELPDSVTKLTWDNAALLSPATAADLGLSNEQEVRLSYQERELTLPVWIVPGQAAGTVVLSLGYGRTAAGRVGDAAGFNAYALRTSAAPDFGRGASLSATGGSYLLAQTQDHGSMKEPDLPLRPGKERPLVRRGTLDEFRANPEFPREMVEVPHNRSIWEDREYNEGLQWGMSIDLGSCTGCNTCVVACQSENNVPIVGKQEVRNGREMHWLRLDRYFQGDPADPETLFQPVPCMHCENAPCEQVCPVAATVHNDEGLNSMVYNRCIGTRYCANNCPYKVRRFNFFNYTKDTPESLQLASNPDVTVRSRGVMEKCTYCVQRLNAARIDAKLQSETAKRDSRYAGMPEPQLVESLVHDMLASGELQTACQQACPADAISFGNVLHEPGAVAQDKALPHSYSLLEEMHCKPRTTYVAKLTNPHGSLVDSGGQHSDEGHG